MILYQKLNKRTGTAEMQCLFFFCDLHRKMNKNPEKIKVFMFICIEKEVKKELRKRNFIA